MKRRTYLFPLMAMTALSLTLAACDDKKDNETAATETVSETTTTTDTAATAAATAVINAEGATAYATAEGQTNGAVFLTLHNPQAVADRLVGASTPVASMVELHQSTVDANGVATMQKVDAIEVQPGQQVSLKPDGYHIMLMGLTAPLTEGSPFDITLDFETAADVVLPVTVVSPTATTGAATMDHSTMGAADSTGTAMPTDGTTTTTMDESPDAATTATDEPMTSGTSADETTPPTTTTAPGNATPDMAPTSSAPNASTTTPTAE